MLAFSAMPADGSTGPDVYLWRDGQAKAQRLTSDHRSYFASWDGSRIVLSRAGLPGAAPASRVSTLVLDPSTGEQRTVRTVPMWLPAVDPRGRLAVAWMGSLSVTAAGVTLKSGGLYLVDWRSIDPFRQASPGPGTAGPGPSDSGTPGAGTVPSESGPPSQTTAPAETATPGGTGTPGSSTTPSDAAPTDAATPGDSVASNGAGQGAGDSMGDVNSVVDAGSIAVMPTATIASPNLRPALTGGARHATRAHSGSAALTRHPPVRPTPTPTRKPSPSPSTSPSPSSITDPVLEAVEPNRDEAADPVLDWIVRWSQDGTAFGYWVADVPEASWGQLTVLRVSPGNGITGNPVLGPTLARRGFSMGADRVAWIAAAAQGTDGELRIGSWDSHGYGSLRITSIDAQDGVPAF